MGAGLQGSRPFYVVVVSNSIRRDRSPTLGCISLPRQPLGTISDTHIRIGEGVHIAVDLVPKPEHDLISLGDAFEAHGKDQIGQQYLGQIETIRRVYRLPRLVAA